MASSSLDEETAKKVLRQVEFYFGDSNLPRDNFLKKSISESEDGMVSLALICSFSRMKSHLNLGEVKPDEVSEDTVKAVAEVLRQSSSLKVSEDGKKIGRSSELLKPEEVIEQSDVRTIAASPLQCDAKLEDVESFFGQYAKVNSVRLPRHVADKRLFCGTALIEFSTEEDAEKVLKQSLVYAGVELELKQKKEFDVERAKKAEEVENSRSLRGSNQENSSNAGANYPKGLIVAFTLKRMLTGGSTQQNGNHQPANDNVDVCKANEELDSTVTVSKETEQKVSENADNNEEDHRDDSKESKENVDNGEDGKESKENVDEKTSSENEGKEEKEDTEKSLGDDIPEDEEKAKDEEKTRVEGKFIAAIYKDNNDIVLREDLRLVFEKFGTVKFIDFKFGADSGYIRFEQPEAAQKARAAAVLAEEGGLIVKNYIATLEPVTGDAESEYWSLLRGNKERYWENKGNRGRGGKHNRGGRQFNKKQARSRDGDFASGRPNKAQKVGAV
ncbi:la protein 1 [Malania oleifera]|uniref:la protein 1 n=1 Tax=Malania oleifera TaxID=397392 RepID=UPI0025AEBE3F|nr:la protein 1 [Malania oleifera]